MYRQFLAEEGYVPQIDDDGDVLFKFEGANYFIAVDEDDDQFFRVVLPNFWPIESEEERELVAAAALLATMNVKATKVFPVGDDTWASIEMFCSPPEAFKPVFLRCLRAIQAAVSNFRDAMQQA